MNCSAIILGIAAALLALPVLADHAVLPYSEGSPWCTDVNTPCSKESVKPVDRSWHVLVVTVGGTVTLMKDLTEEEAKHTAAKLLGQPYTKEEIAAANKAEAVRKAIEAKCHADEKKSIDAKEVASRFPWYCGNSVGSWAAEASDIRLAEAFQ